MINYNNYFSFFFCLYGLSLTISVISSNRICTYNWESRETIVLPFMHFNFFLNFSILTRLQATKTKNEFEKFNNSISYHVHRNYLVIFCVPGCYPQKWVTINYGVEYKLKRKMNVCVCCNNDFFVLSACQVFYKSIRNQCAV